MANLDFSKICFNCMGELRTAGERCPHCGYDNRRRSNDAGFLASSVLNNQYFVGRALGRGGFGITYLGYDMNLKRRVAIKEYFPRELAARASDSITLTPYTDSKRSFEYGMKRALDEGVIIANMGRVPNVVQVYNAFRANGTAYVVMEYIDGRTLSNIVRRRGRLPWRYAWELLRPVEKALEQIHAKGVIHRDVSPDNIMLPNGTNETMLLDFGAAHPYVDINEGHTRSLRPGFAPAEQYSSKSLQDGRTDEYALCATYYYLVTGVIPVGADQIAAGVEKLAAPVDLGADIPKQVEDVLLKGMSVNMADRYATIKDLSAAFEAALAACPEQGQKETVLLRDEWEDEPNDLKPRPSSVGGRTPKPNRKKGLMIALICAVVVLAAALVVVVKPEPEPEPKTESAQEAIQAGNEAPAATESAMQMPKPESAAAQMPELESTAMQEPSEEPQPESAELSEAEVRELQAKLIALNLLPAGSDSGSMDQATEEALKRFQVRLNEWQGDELVTPNGEPDALTLTWLDFYYEEKQKETPTPTPEPSPTPKPTEVPCVFTEPAIEAAVRKIIGKSTGDIYPSELEVIKTLDLSHKDIGDIGGLSGLKNLTSLTLIGNHISDISSLSGLTNLTNLSMIGNNIRDIRALTGLTKLTSLHLSGNDISDIGALSELKNLTTLYLNGNDISNISALRGLTNLKILNLDDNDISDIGALSRLTNLTRLNLSGNPIVDLSPLQGLKAKIVCDPSPTPEPSPTPAPTPEPTEAPCVFTEPAIEAAIRGWLEKPTGDIYLAELKEITKLDLSNKGISDIGDLSDLTNLRWLYLNDNNISDISALSGLTQLTHLDLSNNSISDISALRGLTNLLGLRLSGNRISDTRALSGLTNLGTLYLDGNPISDRSLLEGLDAAMIIYEPTPTPKPTNTPTPPPPDYNYEDAKFDQKRGDQNDTVKKIQQRLIELGYLDDSADGSFDLNTQEAVEAFQRNNGIHGRIAHGTATTLTQAVLFSDEALPSDHAPRLLRPSWSILSEPYSIMRSPFIAEEDGDMVLHFRIRNNNATQPIVALVVRYFLVDSNNIFRNYEDFDNNMVSGYQAKQWGLNIGSGEMSEYTVKLVDSPSLKKADHLYWTVTELAYGNGEVFIDYNTSIYNDYDFAGYSTDF